MDSCSLCGKKVYPAERITADDLVLHKICLRCAQCNKVLSVGNYASGSGKFYCKPHFKQAFMAKGNYDEGFGTEKHAKNWSPQANMGFKGAASVMSTSPSSVSLPKVSAAPKVQHSASSYTPSSGGAPVLNSGGAEHELVTAAKEQANEALEIAREAEMMLPSFSSAMQKQAVQTGIAELRDWAGKVVSSAQKLAERPADEACHQALDDNQRELRSSIYKVIGLTSSGFAPAAVNAKSRLSQDITKLRGQTPSLKPVAQQKDASKPVIESSVQLKKDVRPNLMAEVKTSAPTLKHSASMRQQDRSAPIVQSTVHVQKSATRPQLMADIKQAPKPAAKPVPFKPTSTYSATSTYKPYASSYSASKPASSTPSMSAAAAAAASSPSKSSPSSYPSSSYSSSATSSLTPASSSASPPFSSAALPASTSSVAASKPSGAADVSDILASLGGSSSVSLGAPPPQPPPSAPAPTPPAPSPTSATTSASTTTGISVTQVRDMAKDCARLMTSIIKGDTSHRTGILELKGKAALLIDGAKLLCSPLSVSVVVGHGESLFAAINRASNTTYDGANNPVLNDAGRDVARAIGGILTALQ